jgi:hypothetical protein
MGNVQFVDTIANGEPRGLVTIRAADVQPERVRWLWPGRVPFGKLTVLDGDPGLGKSTMTIDLTGRVSTASPMPDGHRPDKPMKVMLLSAEDGVADTIRPRLEVAGADLDLVEIVDHVTDDSGPRPVEIPADLDRIEVHLASEAGYGLMVVDPLMAFHGRRGQQQPGPGRAAGPVPPQAARRVDRRRRAGGPPPEQDARSEPPL